MRNNANFPKFYTSLCSEVSYMCDYINSYPSETICTVCHDCTGRFCSAINVELAYRAIRCEGCMGPREYACAAALEVFRHLSLWHLSRYIFAFVKVYQDLVAQEMYHHGEFVAANKKN